MMYTPAIRIETVKTIYVVYPMSLTTYRIERHEGLELIDVWEAESFTALGEVMDFLTGEDEDWDMVFRSIEG